MQDRRDFAGRRGEVPRDRSNAIELAAVDPAIDGLDTEARALIARIWRERAANELRTSTVFANLHRALVAAGAHPSVLRLTALAVSDEVRHADICTEVAARYEGTEMRPFPAVEPIDTPVFRGCDDRQNRLLFAVIQCCMNETIAASFLTRCIEQAAGPVVRGALRRVLEDEVDHARIGWAHLASREVADDLRRTVGEAAPALLDIVAKTWTTERQGEADAPAGHGALATDDLRSVVWTTAADVIIPGLEHLSIDAAPARAWLARVRAGVTGGAALASGEQT